jgi:CheY-like chemotaxis protein
MDGAVTVRRVCNASLAQQYLKGEPPFTNREDYPLPDVIVCDLRMPAISGLEFLEWVRGNADFRAIPFFVLTDSELAEHRQTCLAGGAQGFLVKPSDLDQWPAPVSEMLRNVSPTP